MTWPPHVTISLNPYTLSYDRWYVQLSCLLPTYILAPHSSCYSQKWKMSHCPVYFPVSCLRPGQKAVTVQIHMDTFWRLSSYVVYPHSFTWAIVSHDFPPCSNYSYFIIQLHLCRQRPLFFLKKSCKPYVLSTQKRKNLAKYYFFYEIWIPSYLKTTPLRHCCTFVVCSLHRLLASHSCFSLGHKEERLLLLWQNVSLKLPYFLTPQSPNPRDSSEIIWRPLVAM